MYLIQIAQPRKVTLKLCFQAQLLLGVRRLLRRVHPGAFTMRNFNYTL